MYVFQVADSSCANLCSDSSWLKVVQFISVETWNETNFFAFLHDFGTGLLLKEVPFTEYIDENRWYLFVLDGLLDGRDLI